jgi:hypothetical protein
MPEFDKDRLEVERVMNLVQGFGWEKTGEQITDTHTVITIRKKRAEPEAEMGAGPS